MSLVTAISDREVHTGNKIENNLLKITEDLLVLDVPHQTLLIHRCNSDRLNWFNSGIV